MPWELPKRPLTWRAYATTALAHFLISAFNLLESMSFSCFPCSIGTTSTDENQRSKRLRFAGFWPLSFAMPLPSLKDKDFFTDMAAVSAAARIAQYQTNYDILYCCIYSFIRLMNDTCASNIVFQCVSYFAFIDLRLCQYFKMDSLARIDTLSYSTWSFSYFVFPSILFLLGRSN